jgi:hypothetical protein
VRYDPDNLDPNFCMASVPDSIGWRSSQCSNARKYGDLCGIHSPEKQAERAKKRGPTRFERECAARRKRATRERALEGVLIAARKTVEPERIPELRDENWRRLREAVEHYDKVTDES